MKILSCNSNKDLAQSIATYVGVSLSDATIKYFADGEIFVKINENIRGEDIYIIQSTSPPVNNNLMELLICIDAARRASAKRITAVIPYFGYARQDRKDEGRTSIAAKLVANLITSAGANRVVTTDLHAGQIQGFFDIPLDNLFAVNELIQDMKKITDKRREKAGESEVVNIIGDVKDKTCILLDDIADSAGTLCNAARALKNNGANDIYSYIVHGVLSGKAVERIKNSDIKELILTDSIQATEAVKNVKNIRHISIAPLMGEAIKRINSDSSVSALFDY